uniref:Uncharacterized protein n=1 Tax=Neospora caninum (strain Liverpool) TaxID=572307 RepID=A0A0F7U9D2_NEOCL|nr:TPA: hypothetical protein BN1204_008440 [Neospora caninum Liverpool]
MTVSLPLYIFQFYVDIGVAKPQMASRTVQGSCAVLTPQATADFVNGIPVANALNALFIRHRLSTRVDVTTLSPSQTQAGREANWFSLIAPLRHLGVELGADEAQSAARGDNALLESLLTEIYQKHRRWLKKVNRELSAERRNAANSRKALAARRERAFAATRTSSASVTRGAEAREDPETWRGRVPKQKQSGNRSSVNMRHFPLHLEAAVSHESDTAGPARKGQNDPPSSSSVASDTFASSVLSLRRVDQTNERSLPSPGETEPRGAERQCNDGDSPQSISPPLNSQARHECKTLPTTKESEVAQSAPPGGNGRERRLRQTQKRSTRRPQKISTSSPCPSSRSSPSTPSVAHPVPSAFLLPSSSSCGLLPTEDKNSRVPTPPLPLNGQRPRVAPQAASTAVSCCAPASSSSCSSSSSGPPFSSTSSSSRRSSPFPSRDEVNRTTPLPLLTPTQSKPYITPQSPGASRMPVSGPRPRQCFNASSFQNMPPLLSSPPPPQSPLSNGRGRHRRSDPLYSSAVAVCDTLSGVAHREDTTATPVPVRAEQKGLWSSAASVRTCCLTPPRTPVSGSVADQRGEHDRLERSPQVGDTKAKDVACGEARSCPSTSRAASPSVSVFSLEDWKEGLSTASHRRQLPPRTNVCRRSPHLCSRPTPQLPSCASVASFSFDYKTAHTSATLRRPRANARQPLAASSPFCCGVSARRKSTLASGYPSASSFSSRFPVSSPWPLPSSAFACGDDSPLPADERDSNRGGRTTHAVEGPSPSRSSLDSSPHAFSSRTACGPYSCLSYRPFCGDPPAPDADLRATPRFQPRRDSTADENETESDGYAGTRGRSKQRGTQRERGGVNSQRGHKAGDRAPDVQGRTEQGGHMTEDELERQKTEQWRPRGRRRSSQRETEDGPCLAFGNRRPRNETPPDFDEESSLPWQAQGSTTRPPLPSHPKLHLSPSNGCISVHVSDAPQDTHRMAFTSPGRCLFSPSVSPNSALPVCYPKSGRLRFFLPTPCSPARPSCSQSTKNAPFACLSSGTSLASPQCLRDSLSFSSFPSSLPASPRDSSGMRCGCSRSNSDNEDPKANTSTPTAACDDSSGSHGSFLPSAEATNRGGDGKAKEGRTQRHKEKELVRLSSLRSAAWRSVDPAVSPDLPPTPPSSSSRLAASRRRGGNLIADRRRARTCEEAFVLATERAFGVTWKEAIRAVKRKRGMFKMLQEIFAQDETRFRVGMRLWAEELSAGSGFSVEEERGSRWRRPEADPGKSEDEAGKEKRGIEWIRERQGDDTEKRGRKPLLFDRVEDTKESREGSCVRQASSHRLHAAEDPQSDTKGQLLDDLVRAIGQDWKKLPIVLEILREGAVFFGSPFLPSDRSDGPLPFPSCSSFECFALRSASGPSSSVLVSASVSSHLLRFLRVLSSLLTRLALVYPDAEDLLPRMCRSTRTTAYPHSSSHPLITDLASLLYRILSSLPSLALPPAHRPSPTPLAISSLSPGSFPYSADPSLCSVLADASVPSSSSLVRAGASRSLTGFFLSAPRKAKAAPPSLSRKTKLQASKAEQGLSSLADLLARILALLGRGHPRRFLRDVLPEALLADEDAVSLVALRLLPLWGDHVKSILGGGEVTEKKRDGGRGKNAGEEEASPRGSMRHQMYERGEHRGDERDDTAETSSHSRLRKTAVEDRNDAKGVQCQATGDEEQNVPETRLEKWIAASEYLLQSCCNEISVFSFAPPPARQDSIEHSKDEEDAGSSVPFLFTDDPLLLHLSLLASTLRQFGPFLASAQNSVGALGAQERAIENHAQHSLSGQRKCKRRKSLNQALSCLSTLLKHPRTAVRQAAAWHIGDLLLSCFSGVCTASSPSASSFPHLFSAPAHTASLPRHAVAQKRGESETRWEEAQPLASAGETGTSHGESGARGLSRKEGNDRREPSVLREKTEKISPPLALLPVLWETKVLAWDVLEEQSENGKKGTLLSESGGRREAKDRDACGDASVAHTIGLRKRDTWQTRPLYAFLCLLEEDRRNLRIDTTAVLKHALPALVAMRPSTLHSLHFGLLAAFLLHPRIRLPFFDPSASSSPSARPSSPLFSCSYASSSSALPSLHVEPSPRPSDGAGKPTEEPKRDKLNTDVPPPFPSRRRDILSLLLLAFCCCPSLRQDTLALSAWLPSFLAREMESVHQEEKGGMRRTGHIRECGGAQHPQRRHHGDAAEFLLAKVAEEERREVNEGERDARERKQERRIGDGDKAGQERQGVTTGERKMRNKEVLQEIRKICEAHIAMYRQRQEARGSHQPNDEGEHGTQGEARKDEKAPEIPEKTVDLEKAPEKTERTVGGVGRQNAKGEPQQTPETPSHGGAHGAQPGIRSSLSSPLSLTISPLPCRSSPCSSVASPCLLPTSPQSVSPSAAAECQSHFASLLPVRERLAKVEACDKVGQDASEGRRRDRTENGRSQVPVGERKVAEASLQDVLRRDDRSSRCEEERRKDGVTQAQQREQGTGKTGSSQTAAGAQRKPPSPSSSFLPFHPRKEDSGANDREWRGNDGGRTAEGKRLEEDAACQDAAEEECRRVLAGFKRTVSCVFRYLQASSRHAKNRGWC